MSSYPAAGVDYNISDTVTALIFTAGDMSEQCAYITIVDDIILEYDEQFSVHLDTHDDDDVKLLKNNATIDIVDDDCKFWKNEYESWFCYYSIDIL